MDMALVWHLYRYRELRDNDTWVNYSAAIRTEYRNDREAADTQLKLGQLHYQGSIRTYLMEFQALNLFVRTTGEVLKEKIDLAMMSEILTMHFAHYLGEFKDDKRFLQATYQVGVQVERLKTLEKARETLKGAQPPKDDKRKDGQNKGSSDNARKDRENTKETGRRIETQNSERKSQYGQPGRLESRDAALEGVPEKEKEEYGRNRNNCWRCGGSGHRTYECFSFNTKRGTTLATYGAQYRNDITAGVRARAHRETDAKRPGRSRGPRQLLSHIPPTITT